MNTLTSRLATAVVLTLLGACATTPPFDAAHYHSSPSPSEASADQTLTAAQVLWGGVIIQTTNVSGGTEIEVLDYPLAGGQRPDVAKTARGRFIATTERYLETVDYAAGRQITLIGRITGVRNGKIGEADYRYAIVALDDIHLWPVATTTSAPRFTFGIGINIEK